MNIEFMFYFPAIVCANGVAQTSFDGRRETAFVAFIIYIFSQPDRAYELSGED